MHTTDPHKSLAAALGRIASGLFILTARQGKAETGMLASWVQVSVAGVHRHRSFRYVAVDVPPRRDASSLLRDADAALHRAKLLGPDRYSLFDDTNRRLIFRDKQGHEYISVPYDTVMAVYGDTRSRRPTSATILGSASIYTLPALLIRNKYRYLTLQFNDKDTHVQGTTSFKLDSKELLETMVAAVAQKAELERRGEAYVRKPKVADNTP